MSTIKILIPVTIASYNILVDNWAPNAKPALKGMRWEERVVSIVEKIQKANADIVCVQEVDKFDSLSKALSGKGYMGIYHKRNNYQSEGCAVFYRDKVFSDISNQPYFFNDGSGRMAMMVRLKPMGGKELQVLNTHLHFLGGHSSKEKEMLLNMAAQSPGPTLICGDFNVPPKSDLISQLADKGFVDVHQKCSKPTFTQKNACGPDTIKDDERIDFICASKGIVVKSADVLGDVSDLTSAVEPSDHLPIVAELLIEPATKTYNNQTTGTFQHKLFQRFNYEARFWPQERYDTTSASFEAFLQECSKTSKNLLDELIESLPDNKHKLDVEFFGFLLNTEVFGLSRELLLALGNDDNDTAMKLFSKLPLPMQGEVYSETYELLKTDGKDAFHNFKDVKNTVRNQAIQNLLLKKLVSLIENKQASAIQLVKELPEPLKNTIYLNTYKAAIEQGIKVEDEGFGKAAFRSERGLEVTHQVRISALKASYTQTT